MKIVKPIFLTIFILTIVGLSFRGWFYRHLVTYKSVGLRNNYSATSDKLVDYINANSDKQTNPDIEQIIEFGLSITSRKLKFSAKKSDTDPNKLINTKAAHCVGYTSFFAATCNYLLKAYRLDDVWTAKPQVGQLYLLGTNIHRYFSSPFFKDHDFVTIENIKTGQTIAVDPVVNDYLYIDFVKYSK